MKPIGVKRRTRGPAAPFRNAFSVFATTPRISSTFPASLVRLKLVRCPHSLAPTLVVLPSMSLAPPLHSLRSRTPAVLLYLGTFPMRSTVALTAVPAMSFIPFTPLFNGSGRSALSRWTYHRLVPSIRYAGDFLPLIINASAGKLIVPLTKYLRAASVNRSISLAVRLIPSIAP